MDSIEEVLFPTEESTTVPVEESTPEDTAAEEEATGETSQVAAEKSEAEVTAAQIKAELSALAQERARVRQKEAALDEERSRLSSGTEAAETQQNEGTGDPRAELKELRKQHRNALMEGLSEDDVDAIEDRMEELRLSIYNQAAQATTAQQREQNEFSAVYTAVHNEFPFLQVDHPEANQDVIDDINTYYEGRVRKGDSHAAALRTAVDKFAPAYAKSLGSVQKNTGSNDKARKAEADRIVAEKLEKSGFSEVRSIGRAQAIKPFTGYTPMEDILKKAA